jgi:hypothetical protein
MNNPSEIARETLKLLASRKLAATPANYTLVYQEISGEPNETGGAETILIGIAQRLVKESPKTSPIGKSLKQAISSRDWTRCQNELQQFLFPSGNQSKQAQPWSDLIRDLLRQLEITHKGITLARKKESVEMVLARFGTDPATLSEKLQGLVRSWSGGGAESLEVAASEQPPAMASITVSPETLATATPDVVSAPTAAPTALLSQLADDDEVEAPVCRAGDAQYVVDAHQRVGDDDGLHRAPEGAGRGTVLVVFLGGREQLVGDPHQAEPADEHEAGDLEQPDDGDGHRGADRDRADGAPDDGAPAQQRRQVARGHRDDDRVVSGKDDVDEDDDGQG